MTYTTYMHTNEPINPEHLFDVARQAVGIPPTVGIINTSDYWRQWYPTRSRIESVPGGYDAAVRLDFDPNGYVERNHCVECDEPPDCECPPICEWRARIILDTGYWDSETPGQHERYVNEITRATGVRFQVEVSY